MTLQLSQKKPLAGINTDLYVTPASKQSVISSLSACNFSAATDYIRVYITPSGNAYDQNSIYYDLELVASDTFLSTGGFTVPYGSKVVCYSQSGGVAFSVFLDETTV